jgi:hypothetical protein
MKCSYDELTSVVNLGPSKWLCMYSLRPQIVVV